MNLDPIHEDRKDGRLVLTKANDMLVYDFTKRRVASVQLKLEVGASLSGTTIDVLVSNDGATPVAITPTAVQFTTATIKRNIDMGDVNFLHIRNSTPGSATGNGQMIVVGNELKD